MRHKSILKALFISLIFIFILSMPFSGCTLATDSSDSDTTSTDLPGPVIRKPNIYIYPTKETELTVKINFPNGGSLIESIPAYKDGWRIRVDSTGLINNTYRYLYYECTTPDLFQHKQGWIVPKDSLTGFFTENLKQSGFSRKEISDFLEYWIPVLHSAEYFAIYPQYKKDILPIVQLDFSIQPDNLLRLFYFIKECDKAFRIDPPPEMTGFSRTGFHVVEWGAIFNDDSAL